MIQHSGSLSNFFLNNAHKLKKKQSVTRPHFILSLKKRCIYFSKQQNNKNTYLKKPTSFFVKTHPILLVMLLLDFTTLIRQKIIKISCFLYKKIIKKVKGVSKKTSVFIKNTTFVFLPQQTLKHQQKWIKKKKPHSSVYQHLWEDQQQQQ